MEEILLPIMICVVLPVAIVWIVTAAQIKKRKTESDILLAAIEKNPNTDINEYIKALKTESKQKKSREDNLVDKLLAGITLTLIGAGLLIIGKGDKFIVGGIITGALGIGFLVAFFVGKHMYKNSSEGE